MLKDEAKLFIKRDMRKEDNTKLGEENCLGGGGEGVRGVAR